MSDYAKKSDLVRKLSFSTLYNDKIKVNYDEEFKKLEEFEIKFYNEIINRFIEKNQLFCYCSLEK